MRVNTSSVAPEMACPVASTSFPVRIARPGLPVRSVACRARVQRKSKGFLSREKVVRAIEVDMGDNTYTCVRGGPAGVQASRRKVVRGIALSSEELALDQWIDALAADMAAEAQASAEARERRERMLG